MNKLVEIAKAWITAAKPTNDEKEIAEKRIAVCNTCEYSRYNKAIDLHYCGECGCPLNKKIFSPLRDPKACPKEKWPI